MLNSEEPLKRGDVIVDDWRQSELHRCDEEQAGPGGVQSSCEMVTSIRAVIRKGTPIGRVKQPRLRSLARPHDGCFIVFRVIIRFFCSHPPFVSTSNKADLTSNKAVTSVI